MKLSLSWHWTLFVFLVASSAIAEPTSGPKTDPRSTAVPIDEAPAPATAPRVRYSADAKDVEASINELIASMTLAEKIGQMSQVAPDAKTLNDRLHAAIKGGQIGSLINVPSRQFADEAQRIARKDSRLGIPLLIGRDVIHGYRTVFPIPLGQAATWDPELIGRAAKIAADEARQQGINWTFAPMVDITRDPRWGRIAETLGEDPALNSALNAAMIRGFQQEENGRLHGLVACAKHFAGYGFAEGGRDYNRTSISNIDLHNVCLAPFHAAVEAGCRTLMTTFSDVNGVPGTAQKYLLRDVLEGQWQFNGFVVSDWNSVIEMVEHGFSADQAAAAAQSVNAGVDMEMASSALADHLAELVDNGAVSQEVIDDAVRRILRIKYELAADESASSGSTSNGALLRPSSLQLARKLSRESLVLLQNKNDLLPLKTESLKRIAVIGELADSPKNQLGCWTFDGDPNDAITPLEALRDAVGDSIEIFYARGAAADFSQDARQIDEACKAAEAADVVLLFVGEDALLTGEAHCRSDLSLPGVQPELVKRIAQTGKPAVMVVMAGRPLTIGAECDAVDAVLYAWHPGTMGGPAIVDVLLGAAAPSGKLPVTIPRSVGQIPLYYAHSNTGRPSPADYQPLTATHTADLAQLWQFKSHYLDADPTPLFPFGFGLSYTTFAYEDLELGAESLAPGQTLAVRAKVTNIGSRAATEVVQLYIRDLVSSIVRPVRELKAFRRIHLRPGESRVVEFALPTDQLAYLDAQGRPLLEPGQFSVWVGGDSNAALHKEFELTGAQPTGEPAVAGVSTSEEQSR
jgi:beta-glucosidase